VNANGFAQVFAQPLPSAQKVFVNAYLVVNVLLPNFQERMEFPLQFPFTNFYLYSNRALAFRPAFSFAFSFPALSFHESDYVESVFMRFQHFFKPSKAN